MLYNPSSRIQVVTIIPVLLYSLNKQLPAADVTLSFMNGFIGFIMWNKTSRAGKFHCEKIKRELRVKEEWYIIQTAHSRNGFRPTGTHLILMFTNRKIINGTNYIFWTQLYIHTRTCIYKDLLLHSRWYCIVLTSKPKESLAAGGKPHTENNMTHNMMCATGYIKM